MKYDFSPILNRLRQVKNNRGLTNDELSEMSGIPLGTLNKILSGATTEPKLPALMSIATALGVSVDYLIYGESSDPTVINTNEYSVITKYRRLNDSGKEYIDTQLDYALSQDKYIQGGGNDPAGCNVAG